ncbi:unnamed protein product [Oppiella nova]|uniref:Cytochrome P450 n=1 Tax=Oppiella nova TaxID=334625 RepID=A0A7R9M4L1_9ACAR|nr:unnamed protein product [Oppiella nova]CAG2170656.1 unnamed protein product [Oppiella nova]
MIILGYYAGHRPVLTVAEPELIKSILIRDFNSFTDRIVSRPKDSKQARSISQACGDDWRRLRHIISRAFTTGRMKRMYPSIRQCLRDFQTHLDACAQDRRPLNVMEMFGNFSMDVMATCALATKTNVHNDRNNPVVRYAKSLLDVKWWKMIAKLALPSRWLARLTVTNTGQPEELVYFNKLMTDIIETRSKFTDASNKYTDFLQTLLDANKDSDAAPGVYKSNEEPNKPLKGTGDKTQIVSLKNHLSDDEVRAQIYFILTTAYDTLKRTLAYAIYELAINPHHQQRLFVELREILQPDGDIDYDVLQSLPFMEAVVSETIRLHLPGLRFIRLATRDYTLGTTGITLRKGDQVDIPAYAMHHSQEYFKQPFQFDPDRFFDPERRQMIKPYTYLPWGAGPRNCIGMRISLLVIKLTLAHVVRRYRLYRTEDTDVPLQYKRNYQMTHTKQVIVGIERRPH